MTRALELSVGVETQQQTKPSIGGDGRTLCHLKRLVGSVVVASILSVSSALAEVPDDAADWAAFAPTYENKVKMPQVLSDADAARYSQIFALQRQGDMQAADDKIRRLSDRVLMGHVLYQRFMHPKAYRSTFEELKQWLDQYADHPEAFRVYRLALRRQPRGTRAPERPRSQPLSLGPWVESNPLTATYTGKSGNRLNPRERDLIHRILVELRKGRPTAALKLLRRHGESDAIRARAYDHARARIAAGYFFEGMDQQAFDLAVESAKRSRNSVESADWIAGLAAWRLRRYADAQHHFEALAHSKSASPWNVAAGAYWAARSALVNREPIEVNPLLAVAADYPRTFYGLLSARLLGKQVKFHWDAPPLAANDLLQLMRIPSITRVIALAEAGRHDLADLELRGIYLSGREMLGAALVGLANRLQMPATQLRLARTYRMGGGKAYDAALFPMPPWRPDGGFQVDRALIFAYMRQESAFVVRAQSQAGARGLMQIMPRTASYVANDSTLRGQGKDKLLRPEFNIEIGQRYLDYLLKDRRIRGNLLHLAVAYNSGPSRLSKWLKTLKHDNDPLMFMESIPSRETRFFVERVLTNFWIYRERMRQDTPSLDAVATGHWPIYLALDKADFELAQKNGRD